MFDFITILAQTVGLVAFLTVFITVGICLLFALTAIIVNKVGRDNKLLWGIVGPFIVLDWIYNCTFGSILFGEWPKTGKELATDRLKRYKRKYTKGYRYDLSCKICSFLNRFMEGHC